MAFGGEGLILSNPIFWYKSKIGFFPDLTFTAQAFSDQIYCNDSCILTGNIF
jgi:hypothetical protein